MQVKLIQYCKVLTQLNKCILNKKRRARFLWIHKQQQCQGFINSNIPISKFQVFQKQHVVFVFIYVNYMPESILSKFYVFEIRTIKNYTAHPFIIYRLVVGSSFLNGLTTSSLLTVIFLKAKSQVTFLLKIFLRTCKLKTTQLSVEKI